MNINLRKVLITGVLSAFLVNTFGPLPLAQAQDFRLPAPGVMVHLSPEFNPPILKGIKVHPNNPFRFDFILDKGDSQLSNDALKDESSKLIKYFLASLTIPEKDLWVNLSPYEKDRIIPQSFGLTEMGRDLLAEDYMLKQITASLIYPEGDTGRKFWKRIYEVAAQKFGTTNIPVNTFNKVWIVPEKAVVYENAKVGTAYVVESKLKVMLEQDYLSLEKHEGIQSKAVRVKDTNQLGSQIVREVVIPQLTKEVNEDKNFSHLRQVYNSLILATWYKKKIKDSILEQVYGDKNKVSGVNIDDPKEKERIYQRYLQAFKKGVYNYIKEEIDPLTQQPMPRKYFSGGITDLAMNIKMEQVSVSKLMSVMSDSAMQVVEADIAPAVKDMGGEITVKSELGKGTTFAITLTIDRARADIETGDRAMRTYVRYSQDLNIDAPDVRKSWTDVVAYHLKLYGIMHKLVELTNQYGYFHEFPPEKFEELWGQLEQIDWGKPGEPLTKKQKYEFSFMTLNAGKLKGDSLSWSLRVNLLLLTSLIKSNISFEYIRELFFTQRTGSEYLEDDYHLKKFENTHYLVSDFSRQLGPRPAQDLSSALSYFFAIQGEKRV